MNPQACAETRQEPPDFPLPFIEIRSILIRVIPSTKGIAMFSPSRITLGLLVAGCSLASASALAQSYDPSAPKTRAEVRADLVEWLAAGYDPLDWVDYPENAQRAGAIVAQRRAARMGATGLTQ